MKLSWRQVAAWRARRHHLGERVPRAEMLAVAGELGGLHAQVLSSAELSLWARVEDVERTAVADALWKDRSLVKTWAMRGTLHLLPAAEYPLWQAALSRYRHYEKPGWLRAWGLTRDEMEQMIEAVGAALEDGSLLTRKELSAEVRARTGSEKLGEMVSGSWGSLLKPAAYRGLLCFGPSAGQNVRFTSPRAWLDLGPPVPPEEAALAVTRRYLAAYGPATREDYAHWWGVISPAQAGRLLAALGDDITPVDVEGSEAWVLAESAGQGDTRGAARAVRLLPAFDQYVIATSRHTDALLPGPLRQRIFRPQGWLTPVLTVGGRFEGVWRHERKGRLVVVAIEPFVPLPVWVRKAVEQEAERLAAFLGGTLDLSIDEAARASPSGDL